MKYISNFESRIANLIKAGAGHWALGAWEKLNGQTARDDNSDCKFDKGSRLERLNGQILEDFQKWVSWQETGQGV